MSWSEFIKGLGGGDFCFLSEDGESITFVVVDDPVLLTTKFKGREQERVGCPVWTDDGFVLFITGKRVARRLAKYEDKFSKVAFTITRRGGRNDVNVSYDISILADPEKTKALLDAAKENYKKDMLVDAYEAAKDMAEGT